MEETSAGRAKEKTRARRSLLSYRARTAEDRQKFPLRVQSRCGVPTSALPVQLKGIKVLVVDDEPDALSLVRRILEENEAQVHSAVSSDAAIRILRSDAFDVIVSDIGMPGRDG